MKKVILLCLWLGLYTGIVNAITSFPPSATTNAATNIKINDATLNGKVQANTPTVSAIYFDYGISTSYGASNTKQFRYIIVPTTLTVTSTVGGLSAAIIAAGGDLSTLKNLTITGTINATDFKAMRDNMPQLTELDMTGASISEYTGTQGTASTTSITYPQNTIPNNAFFAKSTLTSIKIPTGTVTIDDYAFYSCNGLTGTFNLPSALKTIGNLSFINCSGISSIDIPSTVTTIGMMAFSGSSALISVNENNTNFASLDGVLFNKMKTTLIQCPTARTGSYIIPASVNTIGRAAFTSCIGLTSITIPVSVTTINDYAFSQCTGLTTLNTSSRTPINLTANTNTFEGIATSTCTLHVPIGSKAAYQATEAVQWNKFSNIIEDLDFLPTITSFNPTSGTIGTTVTIKGTNFSANPANNIVYFGAVKATVSTATETSITVTIPAGATYAPISVTNTFTALSVHSSTSFIPTFSPSKSNIEINDFASQIDFSAGASTGPRCVNVSDIDGDGKPDLITANWKKSISILQNTGNGGNVKVSGPFIFSTATVTTPNDLAIGDLDGDGKNDVVCLNYNGNSMSIFRNKSSINNISFATCIDMATGGNPKGISISDIDGDGKPDIVVSNSISNTLSIFQNISTSANIAFIKISDISTGSGSNPRFVSIGDIDGDGKPDLVVANRGTSIVSIFRNISSIGNLSFDIKKDITLNGYTSLYNAFLCDLDCDGKLDIITTNFDSNGCVSVFLNNSSPGNINFGGQSNFSINNSSSFSITDINGDGKPDLVLSGYTTLPTINFVRVFQNKSTPGMLNLEDKIDYPFSFFVNVATGDLNGDGKPELIGCDKGSTDNYKVSVLQNIMTVTPTITAISPTSGPTTGGTTVTITGTNLTGATVKFGSIDATNVTVKSATEITATAPAGTAGKVDITVTTAGGTSTISSADEFTYITPATLTVTGNMRPFMHCAGSISEEQSFTVSGSDLSSDITINSLMGFEYSTTSGSEFKPSLTLPKNGTSLATTRVYVRAEAYAANVATGNIGISTSGATTQSLAVGAYTGGASYTTSGSTFNIRLGCSTTVSVASTATGYTFTLNNGNWYGTGASVNGTTLTVTNLSDYDTFNIEDEAAGTSVTFANSGTNTYNDNFNLTLNNLAGVVTFNGTSSFSGSNAFSINTDKNTVFATGSKLSAVDGNITLSANMQTTSSTFSGSGVFVNNAVIETTGTGAVSIKGRAGNGSSEYNGYGVTLQNAAKINGNSINVEGHGSSNASYQFNLGVLITASTITCGNGDLTLKGNGGGLNSVNNHGIYIENTSKVTSLGTGTVTLNGVGGNNAGTAGNDNNGVVIWRSEVSTGGGDLIINGTGGGGGNASVSNYNCGVVINQGAEAKATGNGKVTVIGNGGNNSANNTGVNSFGVFVVNTNSKITSSNGNIEVTGNGGGNGGSGTSNHGVYVSNNGMITSEGTTSTVKVTGTGGNGSGNTNYGVCVAGSLPEYFGAITSNGGDITVTGQGGGSGASGSNYGVYALGGGKIKAGNTGSVTVTGIGGNSSGNYNLGIYINSYATIPNYSMISSTGGSVVVNGTGGGNGASASNYGVYATNGGRIVAENNGTVRVIGTGGNNTNAANSSDNMGIKLQNLDTQISSHNGNIELIGNGGNRNGSGSYNYGFYLYDGAKVSSTGTTSSISIEGVGGSSTGTLNDGVTLNSVYYPASITSNGGNIFLTGTEGNSVCKAINFTGYGSSVSTLTNGGNITLKGNSMNIGVAGAIKVHENNSLSILPKTAGTAFELGTTSDDVSGGPIRISAAEFSNLSAGTINIGDLSTGNITINQAFTTYSNLNLITAEGASVIPIATATDVSMVGKNLTIASGTVLKIAIGGATANTNYDQLKTTGNINLAGVDLVLEGSYIPVTGNSFTIVSGASIAGTFNGLADGAYISFNKKLLRINYTSSAVTLTFVPFTISSPTATAIKLTTATLGATIAPANAPVLERGICWSKTAGVTIDNNKTSEGGTTGGTFTVNVSDIRNSTTIYYKGYVVTPDNETILSDEANFSNVPVFTGTGDWKDAERWNVKEVPFDPRSTPVIAGNCTISQAPVDGLEFYDLTINSGAKLTLNADQTLLTNTFTNNAGVSGLVIKASSTLPNATFAYNIGTPSATVEMYSKASWNLEIAKGDRFNWQYFGIPVKTLAYSPVFDNSIVRRYNESATDDASLWKMETADSTLTSGTGYELTQEAAKLYSFKGELRTGDFEAKLPYSIGAQYPGQHIFGNPFTTAVNISQIDYGLNTEQSVYLFNTGTYNNWKEDATSLGNKAGQYTVSTKLTAGVAGIPAQIPSMQGFLMKTTGTNPGSFTFGYYTGGLYINKEMQRAPRTNATDEKVITRIDVTSKQSADRMWIFTEPTCTRNFDNGWDGYKMMGSVVNPQLFAMEADGNYQINAVPTINETYLGFQAGQDTDYTLKFTQLNVASTYNKLYLMDLVDGHIVDITADGSEYSFKASSTPQAVKRFKIVADVDNSTGNTEIVNNNLKISHSNETIYIENRSDQRGTCTIYDLKGVAIKINLFDAQKVSLISTRGLIPGVYLIKAGNGIVQVTEKIIIR